MYNFEIDFVEVIDKIEEEIEKRLPEVQGFYDEAPPLSYFKCLHWIPMEIVHGGETMTITLKDDETQLCCKLLFSESALVETTFWAE